MVNVNPVDSLGEVIQFGENQGWTFPAAEPSRGMLADLGIRQQSIKLAIGADGVITYRDGFGGGDDRKWRQVLEDLAS